MDEGRKKLLTMRQENAGIMLPLRDQQMTSQDQARQNLSNAINAARGPAAALFGEKSIGESHSERLVAASLRAAFNLAIAKSQAMGQQRADRKADTPEKKLPQNRDVLRLAKALKKRGGTGLPKIEIAREIA